MVIVWVGSGSNWYWFRVVLRSIGIGLSWYRTQLILVWIATKPDWYWFWRVPDPIDIDLGGTGFN